MRFWLGLILALYAGSGQAAVGTLGGRQSGPPQIAFNILSPPGGVTPVASCTGKTTYTRTVTFSGTGNKTLDVGVATFSSPADVGKNVNVDGAGAGAAPFRYFGKIVSVTNSQTVVLDTSPTVALSGVSASIYVGFDDTQAFNSFNQWAITNQASNQVVLTIPNGSNCWFATGTFMRLRLNNPWAGGIKNLIVEGTGATIDSVGGSAFWLGGRGICEVGLTFSDGCSARIQTVSAGSSTVTLTAASLAAGYATRFNAVTPQWIMVGGLNTQATFQSPQGYPQNFNYFEWRQITNVNAGTGVITLDRPLTNSYSSAWPEMNNGAAGQADQAGPASIFIVGNETVSTGYTQMDTWNVTLEYRGLTISQEGQTYAPARNVTYRNVTFTGGFGGIPTQNEAWSAINSAFASVNMETDKLVGTMLLDTVTIGQIVNQSTATDRMVIRNSTITVGLDAGAKYTEITDTTLARWGTGTHAYGSTGTADQTICTRCNITALSYVEGYNSASDTWWTKSGSTIAIPFGANIDGGPANRYFVPGARVQYRTGTTNPPTNPNFACCESVGTFLVGAITSDSWPAVDNQSVSMSVTTVGSSNTVTVSGSSFTSGDIGKTIIIPGGKPGPADLRTFITGVSGAGPQTLTVYTAATRSQSAVTQTVQWGTANTYVATNQTGGFPSYTLMNTFGNPPGFGVVGSFNFTCDTCTGDPNAVGASIQAGAVANKPMGSFISRTLTPANAGPGVAIISSLPGRGTFKSLRINVTVAATAAGAVDLRPGSTNNWFLIDMTTPLAPVTYNWTPANLSINTKVAGDRVITPSGVTCNGIAGACSGDVINLPPNLAGMWIMNGQMVPMLNNFYTTAPTFTIELTTDPLQ